MEIEDITADLKNYIFEELKESHDYWGENSLPDMLDFCKRNRLKSQKELLLILMSHPIRKK
ncbi:hypothetical protein M2451_003862 [Dysgonomonas sp. PFB1-18]|uniref:hypothetical protein n=1 Tax=unclassified Dysgonomonas TaxID=2630389 RepID=UPI0024756F74|nr:MULTISPECIES: hypothetical protein [unclassified Dysgonomonas]MDH6311052.1 hypothetical protein [Dysgonomonas sp. PF1-14]MDH6341110.1 hypothetical protein [Dysgonomonas sp. PF1-16]MDH6382521.1 hypothetical protein [Dysgonomonas sp. PFB1-18]MDH6400082.1 hypothetical protein [Dysgonomonas sp. PF1-23]